MKTNNGFVMLSPTEVPAWLDGQKVARQILRVQLHHTWLPDYRHFAGNNHFTRQAAMRESHLARGFSDIAQHFTVFPDGMIVTGRALGSDPAGVIGANKGAVCVECFGNFDAGQDSMTTVQASAVVQLTAALCNRFALSPETSITYHAWWTSHGVALGDYIPAKSAKTCPGTAFFGGNSKAAFHKYFLPRVIAAMKKEDGDMTIYKTYEDCPEWAKPTVSKLVRLGLLKGDENQHLDLEHNMLRGLVINDRAGLYK